MISVMLDRQILVVEPKGYITAANASEFQESLLEKVRSKEYSGYLVDMHQIEFMDSAGLMALVSGFTLAQTLNKTFRLCSIPSSVRIIFELTQLDRIFEIYPSRAQAESGKSQDLTACS